MNILVISDTHGNMDLLSSVLEANIDCDMVIHLGDNYEDLDTFTSLLNGKENFKVPGIFHPQYKSGKLEAEKLVEVEGKKVLLVHSRRDITQIADIYLFGHSHEWELRNSKNGIFLNPGHLRMSEEKGREASYALLKILEGNFHIKLLDYEHKIFLEATL